MAVLAHDRIRTSRGIVAFVVLCLIATVATGTSATADAFVRGGPDLVIDKSHYETFIRGRTASYYIAVQNVGIDPTENPITVVDTLPAGLTFVSAEGTGNWNCGTEGQDVICKTPDVIAPEGKLSLTLTVKILSNALSLVTNAASLFMSGDIFLENNQDTDPTQVVSAGIQTQRDAVALRITGGHRYQLDEVPLTSGDIGVSRSRGRISSIRGSGTYPDGEGGRGSVTFNLADLFSLPLYLGTVRIDDAAANIHLTTVLLFPSLRTSDNRISSSSGWLDFSRFPWKFYSLAWTVVDRA